MLPGLRSLAVLALGAFALASPAAAKSALGIKNAKVSVTSPDGLNDASYTLKEPIPLTSPVVLGEAATFKLAFTVVDTASGEPVFPQQAHLLFEDIKGGDDVTLPVSIKSNGKASFTINTAKAPPALLATHGHFHLTLLLSSLTSYTPLSYPLGELTLPPSILKPLTRKRHDLPARPGEPAFQPEMELFHTFRLDEKQVGVLKAVLGTALALSPWAALLGLITKISPSLSFSDPPTSAFTFLLTLAALEALIFTYWSTLRLPFFLPPFIVLCIIAAYTCKVALTDIRGRRLKAGGPP